MQASPILVRLGGLAAALGGVLWGAKAFHDRNDAPPWPTDITDTLLFVVPVLFLVGLAGLHARYGGRLGADSVVWLGAGALGLAASIAGLLTMTLEAGHSWWGEISWQMFVLGYFVTNLSLLLFGITVVRSGALGRWSGLPLATGVLGLLTIAISDPANSGLGVYPSLAVWMLYGLAWTVMGCVLLVERDSSLAARPARAR